MAELPVPRNLAAELVDRGDGWHVTPEVLVDQLADARHELETLRGITVDLEQRLGLALTDLSRAIAERDEARAELADADRRRFEFDERMSAQVEDLRAELVEARKALDLVRDCHDDGRYGFCCGQAYPCETVQYLDDVSWARAGNRP